MREQKIIMGMPVTIDIRDSLFNPDDIKEVFSYLCYIDDTFSTYKKDSEISKVNQGLINIKDCGEDMKKILMLCEKTKLDTNGYFDIRGNGKLDPSGLVKGFAIRQAAKILKRKGYSNFYLDIGSDIQLCGRKEKGTKWRVGIKNPFSQTEIVKVLELEDMGIATSGTYIRGSHIYNPLTGRKANEIASITVIARDVYDADRFATAAFAMGRDGINFLEDRRNLEAYMIVDGRQAFSTSGFKKYILQT
ncbi:MAG: FAD:protein FMN transferase [Patescibacteria group bacterium]|nr:FAD:protein FMN transferase [Patescibacteria group bacterium]